MANALQRQSESKGGLDNLDRVAEIRQQALELTPKHESLAIYLCNSGAAFLHRSEQKEALADLHGAIALNQRAVESAANDYPARATSLSNLAVGFSKRYKRKGTFDDLDCAIAAMQKAITLTPKTSPDLNIFLVNFGTMLQSQFARDWSSEDLYLAISTTEQALATTSSDHWGRVGCLSNLGNQLLSKFILTGSLDDLNRSIETFDMAVASTPNDQPDSAKLLTTLASALQFRFKRTGATSDFDRAVGVTEKAVGVVSAPPSIRIDAAITASRLLLGYDNHRAKDILEMAIHLLPMVSPRELMRIDQQHHISRFAGIASTAASLSLDCGDDPYNALQLLELGRGVISSLQLEVRSDISALKESHPALAQQFEDIRDRLNQSQSNVSQQTDSDTEHRRGISKQFDSILDSIRQLNGYERFLLGRSESELKSLAEGGPIVIFNVSEIRCDALLVNKHDIRSIYLPLLKFADLEAYSREFLSAVQTNLRGYQHAKLTMNKIFAWLWDVAVGPVLEELGFRKTPPSDDIWPRVWWVTCGLLSILPIHAAGYHDSESCPPGSAIDCVISSYIPTMKSLASARQRRIQVGHLQNQKAIFIGMPRTPEQTDLPFVIKEIDALVKWLSLSPNIQTTFIEQPTRAAVLSMLSDYQIVHFSCHGHSSAADPS